MSALVGREHIEELGLDPDDLRLYVVRFTDEQSVVVCWREPADEHQQYYCCPEQIDEVIWIPIHQTYFTLRTAMDALAHDATVDAELPVKVVSIDLIASTEAS